MNKNGVIAVVVVVAAIILVGLWAMRSGEQSAGGLDCSAPPGVPTGVLHQGRRRCDAALDPAPAGDHVTTYVIEAGSQPGANNQGTFVAPGTATTFQRQAGPGDVLRAHVRAQCLRHQPADARTSSSRFRRAHLLRRVLLALQLLAVAAAAGAAVLPLPAVRVERGYSDGLYPALQSRLTAWSNETAFALFDVALAFTFLVLLIAVGALAACVGGGRTLVAGGPRTGAHGRCGSGVLSVVPVAWGLNYAREPLEATIGYEAGRVSRDGAGARSPIARRARSTRPIRPAMTPAFRQR